MKENNTNSLEAAWLEPAAIVRADFMERSISIIWLKEGGDRRADGFAAWLEEVKTTSVELRKKCACGEICTNLIKAQPRYGPIILCNDCGFFPEGIERTRSNGEIRKFKQEIKDIGHEEVFKAEIGFSGSARYLSYRIEVDPPRRDSDEDKRVGDSGGNARGNNDGNSGEKAEKNTGGGGEVTRRLTQYVLVIDQEEEFIDSRWKTAFKRARVAKTENPGVSVELNRIEKGSGDRVLIPEEKWIVGKSTKSAVPKKRNTMSEPKVIPGLRAGSPQTVTIGIDGGLVPIQELLASDDKGSPIILFLCFGIKTREEARLLLEQMEESGGGEQLLALGQEVSSEQLIELANKHIREAMSSSK